MDLNPASKDFQAAGIHCGIKIAEDKDLALVVSDIPAQAAGVFTTNRVKAACVQYNQNIINAGKPVRAVLTNSGNANACTGQQGMDDTHTIAAQVASSIGCQPDEVLVLSTGVIGVQLPMDDILPGINSASQHLRPDGWLDAATAIMTTDSKPKIAFHQSADGYTIIGISKGSGMIAPHMATMLAIITTDAIVPQPVLANVLKEASDKTFNRIVVDGDMSTNDTVLLLANGASGVEITLDDQSFRQALLEVCTELAHAIVRDGEGATKFVTVEVNNAGSEQAAIAIARAIATSPLCKTAFYGADPNWGRFVCAAGYAGVEFDPERIKLWLVDEQSSILLFEKGQPTDYNEPAATHLMQQSEWGLRLDLSISEGEATVWTCDLSHDYVTINGHYRT